MEIWLIHTTNFSARMIHLGMKIYCWLRGKKVPEVIYNHALVFDGTLITEADYPVVDCMGLKAWKNKKKNQTAIIKKLPLDLSIEQNNAMWHYLNDQEGKKYELLNFWWHLVKIFTGKWYGKRNDNQHYCYELVLWALNMSTGSNYDVYMNPIEFAEKFKVYE